MGSFYMTGHSGVTTEGEECILFFVVQNDVEDEVYGLYKPISGPIPCTYADYGSYDLIDNGEEVFNDFLEFIKPKMKVFELGENEYHDIPANQDLLTWEYAHRLCHEDRFYGKVRYYMTNEMIDVRIQRFVVHKSYYNTIIEEFTETKWGEPVQSSPEELYDNIKKEFEEDSEKLKASVWFDMGHKLTMRARHLDTDSYRLSYYRDLFNQGIKDGIKDYQLKYIAGAYSFMTFMRSSHLDFLPANYGTQQTGEKGLLRHAELLRETVLRRYTKGYEYLFDYYEDITENEAREMYEEFSKLSEEELMSNKDFIQLVLRKDIGTFV